MDPAASRLAVAGRDAADVAGLHVQEVHLVEGIVGLALALEDHGPAVPAEIALAGPPPLEGQLPHVAQQLLLARGCGTREAEQRERRRGETRNL